MVNFEEQLKLLIELQGFDTRLLKIKDELTSIPERIGAIDQSLKEKGASLKKHEDNLKALQLKRKEKEVELQTKEETIKKYTSQMHQVKTNKEYSALQDEINRVKADNSLIEEDILKIFDQIDGVNAEVAGEKELLKKEDAVAAGEKKKLDADAVRIKGDADKLKIERDGLAAKIDKAILAKYERILKNRGGLAVAPIVDESCQGCFSRMPAQVINEVKMKNAIVCCESCTRILYVEE
ncbi:MAG: hypothetical protein JXB40_01000 [Candidatus Omnitrophica bacterium]|nr:hypothetical protein [Candidatus Omnitrophota bacterium]